MLDVVELQPLGQLRDPVLIVAFAVRRRAGRLPTTALNYLVDEWQAQLVARIEPEGFYDFTVRRPEIRGSSKDTVIDWPETNVYLASPPDSKRDFLLMVGFEPNLRWRAFVEGVAQYMDALGVRTMVNFRCYPGPVPHTRPAPLIIHASELDLELQFGVQARGFKFEGLTDIAGVLAANVEARRWQTADLTVLQPDYFPRMQNAKASLALISAVDRAFGSKTALAALEDEAAEQTRVVDQMFSGLADQTLLHELELNYEKSLERMDFLAAGSSESAELPSGEELVQEIERLFRDGGADPSGDH